MGGKKADVLYMGYGNFYPPSAPSYSLKENPDYPKTIIRVHLNLKCKHKIIRKGGWNSHFAEKPAILKKEYRQ